MYWIPRRHGRARFVLCGCVRQRYRCSSDCEVVCYSSARAVVDWIVYHGRKGAAVTKTLILVVAAGVEYPDVNLGGYCMVLCWVPIDRAITFRFNFVLGCRSVKHNKSSLVKIAVQRQSSLAD